MEFDETPRFWYSRIALDAWTDFAFCSDKNLWSNFYKSYKEAKIKSFFPFLSLSLLLPRDPHCPLLCQKWPFSLFNLIYFLFFFFCSYFLFLFPCFIHPLDTWLNVSHSHKCTTCHALCSSPKVSCGIHRIMPCVTRHPMPRKSEISTVSKFDEIR